ncbi:MAG: hypothetical protein RMJ84_01235, partial [Sandaracinaceae bacterium]|nr:hypothetical protein [Sandaracinaceae bacterium]
MIFTFAAYLFAPFSYRLIEPINHRFLPLAFALLPGLGPIALTPKQFRFALISSIFLSLETATIHYLHFMQSDEEVGELEEALAHTQPGKRLLGLIFEPTSNVIRLPIHLHEHQYYQATVGGLACFSFVEFPKSPLKYRDGAAPPPFPPRFEWEPWKYDHSIWGEAFDYWLIRHSPHQNAPNVFHFSSRAPMPVLVAVLDRWTLYARKELAS